MPFFETSAHAGVNVKEAFDALLYQAMGEKIEREYLEEKGYVMIDMDLG